MHAHAHAHAPTCSFACAMSRATTSVPVRLSRVLTGHCDSCSLILDMGWFRQICSAGVGVVQAAMWGRAGGGMREGSHTHAAPATSGLLRVL